MDYLHALTALRNRNFPIAICDRAERKGPKGKKVNFTLKLFKVYPFFSPFFTKINAINISFMALKLLD